MKKSWYLFLGLFSILISFVSAAAYSSLGTGLGYGVEQLVYIGQSMLEPILYIVFGYGNLMFERILFLLIVFCVVFVVISTLEPFKGTETNKKVIRWIISIAVSLLATRYLTEIDLVKTVLLPYSAFGIGLTCAIPLLLYYKFVMNFPETPTARRILWIFFIVVFFGLWSSRADEVGEFSWIYLATAIIAFFFLLFDGTIQKWIIKSEREQRGVLNKENHLAKLKRERRDIEDNREHFGSERYYNKILKDKDKEIERVARSKDYA